MNVHFIFDECASLGALPQLDDAANKYRGYGVRLTLIFQNTAQVKACFPDGQDVTLLSNVTQVFFGVNDMQTAEYVSNRLGEQTNIVTSGGTGHGTSRQNSHKDTGGSYSTSFNANDNWQQHGRKLYKPEEIMALSLRTAITFAPGVPPICTRLIRYYEERPDSLWRKLANGLRANLFATLLLLAAAGIGKYLAMSNQYELDHPRVRPGPAWHNKNGGRR